LQSSILKQPNVEEQKTNNIKFEKSNPKKKEPTHKVLFLSDGRKEIEKNHKFKY
jgi:hypothetical protein